MISLYELDWIKRASKNLPERKIEELKAFRPEKKDSKDAHERQEKSERARGNPEFDDSVSRQKQKIWGKAGVKYRRSMKKEETEINELSKKTLGRYVNKATSDVAQKSREGTRHAANASSLTVPPDRQKRLWKMAIKSHDKAAGRQVGISKAVDRLSKEETEINELKKKTLKSYLEKAVKSRNAMSDSNLRARNAGRYGPHDGPPVKRKEFKRQNMIFLARDKLKRGTKQEGK